MALEVWDVVNVLIVPTPPPAGVEDVGSTRHDAEILLQTHRHLRQHLTGFLRGVKQTQTHIIFSCRGIIIILY